MKPPSASHLTHSHSPPVQQLTYNGRDAAFAEVIHRERTTDRKAACCQLSHGTKFAPNHLNNSNLHHVSGSILSAHDGKNDKVTQDLPEESFLAAIDRAAKPAAQREEWPQTSAQEIGWFTSCTSPSSSSRPIVHSELTRYMSVFWRYHPPPAHSGRASTEPGFRTSGAVSREVR